ncbi:plasmid mobilization relaxosome protein MobC [Rhodohalobacter sp. SW132]|uniref:DUF6290 family protein n=1 Tax=Rhodohalobacter sp. SW132 TaxID=2293433 RepID=UPI000E25EBD5|nr:DUF6290 family protein [Rhodohalobacter sp. SW132]REL39134.1 plasmid mobilization relaxosome protein MobC [Rhodohalobacter sp. SW132]
MKKEYRKPLSVRLSKNEKAILKNWASEKNVSLSRYIRKIALGELPQNSRIFKRGGISEMDLWELRKELAAVGNNINQIAHRLNKRHLQLMMKQKNGERVLVRLEEDAEAYLIQELRKVRGVNSKILKLLIRALK